MSHAAKAGGMSGIEDTKELERAWNGSYEEESE